MQIGSAHNLIADSGSSGGISHGGDLANIVGRGGTGTRDIATVVNTMPTSSLPNGTIGLAPVAGSLAIDNGNTVKAVDQNGDTLLIDQGGGRRVYDGDGDNKNIVDIGAVEAGPMATNGVLIFDSSNGVWRLGSINGRSSLSWYQTGAFGSTQRGFVGDFNGDGLLDGMMLNMTNLRFNFLRNKGDGTLAAPVAAGALNGNFTWDNFMVGDYDGNGRAEVMAQIVSTGYGQGAMRSQDYLGVNRFYVTLNTGYETLATGDFNGDGYDDVVGLFDNAAMTRTNIIPAYSISTPVGRRMTSVLASGALGLSVAGGGLHDLNVADWNGDGRDDLAVINSNGQVFTATTVGNSRVNAADVRNFVASVNSPRFEPTSFVNPLLHGVFNDDNRADLITIRNTNELATGITTSLNPNGTPIQSLTVERFASVGPHAVTGDFDGDGLGDVLVLGTTAQGRFYNNSFDDLSDMANFGTVLGGPIGTIGFAKAGRVM
ncbi:MAG: VCBS repeat-containing protein [Planctomycetaceae bacterium]|nr:VCBS repeat-containing protein [Planctomycetaceae bacterium]